MQHPETKYRYRLDYRVVLEFRVFHNYYTDGSCRDLEIAPTPDTQSKLRGYQMIFRRERDGFLLAVNGQRDYSAPIFSRPDSLDFSFHVANPHFIRFTDLPFDSSQFHYFESSVGFGGRMHAGGFVDATSIRDADADGVTGLIRLIHDDVQPIIPAWGAAEQPSPRLHYLHFNTRNIRIRYVFHGSVDIPKNFNDYSVENVLVNEKPLTFSTPRLTNLRNGSDAFEIVSHEGVDLKSAYLGHALLKRAKGFGNPFLYKKNLPLPKPANVVFDPICELYFAEIYVKL